MKLLLCAFVVAVAVIGVLGNSVFITTDTPCNVMGQTLPNPMDCNSYFECSNTDGRGMHYAQRRLAPGVAWNGKTKVNIVTFTI